MKVSLHHFPRSLVLSRLAAMGTLAFGVAACGTQPGGSKPVSASAAPPVAAPAASTSPFVLGGDTRHVSPVPPASSSSSTPVPGK